MMISLSISMSRTRRMISSIVILSLYTGITTESSGALNPCRLSVLMKEITFARARAMVGRMEHVGFRTCAHYSAKHSGFTVETEVSIALKSLHLPVAAEACHAAR